MIWLWVIGVALFFIAAFSSLYLKRVIGYGASGPTISGVYEIRMGIFYRWLPLFLYVVFITKIYLLFIPIWGLYELVQRKYKNDLEAYHYAEITRHWKEK